MRGTYTAGVLDCFLDYNVKFDYVIGTSAGATSGLSFLSGQKGRTRFSNIDLLKIHNYVGLKSLLFGGGLIDLHFLFDIYPNKYYPFDFTAYSKSPARFIAVSTNALTGKPVYLEEKNDFPRFLEVCRASCSLPMVTPITWVDNMPLVDGGVSDSIPFLKAMQDGADEIVVVLTKPRGYRKPNKLSRLPWFLLRKYPELRNALIHRNIDYNKQIELLEKLEDEGKIKVIRPSSDCGVTRTSDNTSNLQSLYDLGYKEGTSFIKFSSIH